MPPSTDAFQLAAVAKHLAGIKIYYEEQGSKAELSDSFPKTLAESLSPVVRTTLSKNAETTEISITGGDQVSAQKVLDWMWICGTEGKVVQFEPQKAEDFESMALMVATCEQLEIEDLRSQIMQRLEEIANSGAVPPVMIAPIFDAFPGHHHIHQLVIRSVVDAIWRDELGDFFRYQKITHNPKHPDFVQGVYTLLHSMEIETVRCALIDPRSRELSPRQEKAKAHVFSTHWAEACWPPRWVFVVGDTYPHNPIEPPDPADRYPANYW